MYHPQIISRRLDKIQLSQGWRPTPSPIEDVEKALTHFDQLLGADGTLTRQLTESEVNFIRNERLMCAADFRYYCTRYVWIRDWQLPRLVRLVFNVAQEYMLEIWADLELQGRSVSVQILKARQLGMSTLCEAAMAHRLQFSQHFTGVVGSSDPEKSTKMSAMIENIWWGVGGRGPDTPNMPWWLMPQRTRYNVGELIEFGQINTKLSIQHGTQRSGIARGDTVNGYHLSEISGYANAEEIVDASLDKATHGAPGILRLQESTAKGRGRNNYWHRKWEFNKKNYWLGKANFCPVFLPWFAGTDIWPDPTWLRDHPIPKDWQPLTLTVDHAEKAQEYVKHDPILSRLLGADWEMPKRQQWFWEVERGIAESNGGLSKFFEELCIAGEERVSTNEGLIPIREARGASSTETGSVMGWAHNGQRATVVVETRQGRSLRCTPDHLILLTNGLWKEAQQLEATDTIVLSPPKFSVTPYCVAWDWSPKCRMQIEIDETWGRLLGYFLGDGCWVGDGIEIACDAKDEDTITDVAYCVEAVIGRPPTAQRVGGMVRLRSHSTKWWEMLWNLGVLDRRVHKKQARNSGYKKRLAVPACIWRSPNAVVREFLRALFECDGHANRFVPQTSYFTKDPSLAKEIQLLLLGFGINSCVYENDKKAGSGHTYIGRCVRLNAIASDLYHERVGFVSRRKNSGRRRSPGKLGRNALPNLMEDSVLRVVDGGITDVYDLTVPCAHKFGANGVMVHNCADDHEAFQSSGHSVFSVDLIAELRGKARPPLGIYGIVGDPAEIPLKMQPDRRDIDFSQPPINITANWDRSTSKPHEYQLLPLKMANYPNIDPENKLFIWEFPKAGQDYWLSLDTSYGIGQDQTALQIGRKGTLYHNDFQAAEFTSQWLGAMDIWPHALALLTLFSVPKMEGERPRQIKAVIEVAANGEVTQLELRKRGWNNFHQWMRYDKKKLDQSKTTRVGWFTTNWSRHMALDTFIKAVRDGWLDINSPFLLDEMSTFEAEGPRGKMEAASGEDDDRVMAYAFGHFAAWALESIGARQDMSERRLRARQEARQAPQWSSGLQGRDARPFGEVEPQRTPWEGEENEWRELHETRSGVMRVPNVTVNWG